MRYWKFAVGSLLMSIMLMASLYADAQGTITKNDAGKTTGVIRWLSSSRVYEVASAGVTVTIKPEEVQTIDVEKPADLDKVAGLCQAGQYQSVIPSLEKIIEKYAMLQWDMPAGAMLATAYNKSGQAQKAADMCKKLTNGRPEALGTTADFVSAFWDSLRLSKQTVEMEKQLNLAISSGSKESCAVAYVKRGDLYKDKGDLKAALVDGYLRTVLMFENVKEIQPEALFKTANCFEEMKQPAQADRWRKKLMADYPQSSYIKQFGTP